MRWRRSCQRSLLDEDALRQPGGPVEDSKYCQAVPAGSGSNFKCATVTVTPAGGRVALSEMATKLIMCTGRGFARMPVSALATKVQQPD